MNVIELNDVCYRREGTDILKDVSWSIAKGSHCALLGANGSGKTTLLKVITGYEWVTSGKVTVLGRRFGACNLFDLRKTVGWVSSALESRLPEGDTALEIAVSGLEATMGLYREYAGEELDLARAALASMGIESLSDRAFGRLSQGEQQRVLIARALVPRPALLILDEPCVGLDPAARHLFLRDLEGLAERADAPTMVFVTHHIDEIGPWIKRVMVIKKGTVLVQGTPCEVLTQSVLEDAFSLPCAVERVNSHYRLSVLAGSFPGVGAATL